MGNLRRFITSTGGQYFCRRCLAWQRPSKSDQVSTLVGALGPGTGLPRVVIFDEEEDRRPAGARTKQTVRGPGIEALVPKPLPNQPPRAGAALAGIDVETRQVERTAEALGREVACDERAGPEQTAPASAPTMYLGLDGTGVPVRPAEVDGRRGKQPDGSAKTREVKLATVWTGRRTRPPGPSPP